MSQPLPSGALREYRQMIEQYKPLTNEETRLLFQKKKQGNLEEQKKIKEEIMNAYLTFVIDIAESFTEIELIMVDLIQEGNIALLQAIDAYSADQEKTFLDFSTPFVYDAMESYIKENPLFSEDTPVQVIKKDVYEEDEESTDL